MIELKSFGIGYGHNELLKDVNTVFHGGHLTALIGRNGTGKSTLIRAIAGLNRSCTGSVIIDSREIDTLQPEQLSRRLALVTTERVRVAHLSCRDVVAAGRAPYTNRFGTLSAADNEIVDSALDRVGMSDFAKRSISTLSDGEAQRVMIARALAQQTGNLILDEPTSFLDMPSRRQLAALLNSLALDEGKCVIFSTHELDLATQFATDISLVGNKTILTLPTDRMLASGAIDRMFAD